MGLSAETIITEALELPSTMRAMVAERLIESLDLDESMELSPEWRDEISRRCREIDEGTAQLIPAETVFKRLYAALQ
jgi:putative addiction module component (TIGR02574 family)